MSQKRCAFAYIDAHRAARAKAGSPPSVLTQTFRAGLHIIRQGEVRTHLHMICRGLVIITKLSEEGGGVALQAKGTGEILDLTDWLMDEQTASFSAQALTDTTIAYVKPGVIVARLWKGDQQWLAILFKQLGHQILTLKERLYFQTGEGAPGRVIHCLLHFVQQLRISAPTNIRLPIKLSRVLIAQLTGLSRETVSRVLTDLRQRRLLGGSDGKITIPDLEGLRNALNG
jgi:CRP/FNR family transcriptional regulator